MKLFLNLVKEKYEKGQPILVGTTSIENLIKYQKFLKIIKFHIMF